MVVARHLCLAALLCLVSGLPASAQFASDLDRRAAWEHYQAGERLMAAEQFRQAAEQFQMAVGRDPLFTLAHYGQGQAYMALRRFDAAARAFIACREAFRALHGLQATAGQMVERQRDDEVRALRDIAGRLASDRSGSHDLDLVRLEARVGEIERQRRIPATAFEPPAFVTLALGSAYFRTGRLDDAEREWKAAVAANARFGEAYNNLAALYAMTGRRSEAEDAVRAAERAGFRVHPQLKAEIRGS